GKPGATRRGVGETGATLYPEGMRQSGFPCVARRELLATGAASLAWRAAASAAARADVPPPPMAVPPPPPANIRIDASARAAPFATLPDDALPMLCGYRTFGHAEGDFVGATEDAQGVVRIWTLHGAGDGGPVRTTAM